MVARYFQLRMVKNGPWVPAMIVRRCRCTVNGGDDQAEHDWQASCDRFPPETGIIHDGKDDLGRVDHIRTYGHPISKERYDLMAARAAYDRTHHPASIGANPYTSITPEARHRALMTAPLPFSNRSPT